MDRPVVYRADVTDVSCTPLCPPSLSDLAAFKATETLSDVVCGVD
jgi:hypothetical protein